MSSKYDELAALGVAKSKAFQQLLNECQEVAVKLVTGLEAYLQCPTEKLAVFNVRPDLSFDDQAGEVRRPDLTIGRDGFFYFGIRMKFGHMNYMQLGMILGLKKTGSHFVLRARKDIPLDASKEETFTAFYEMTYEDVKQDLSSPLIGPPRQLGFVPPEQQKT